MEITISQKLDALYKLQSIDSSLDEFRKIKGDLPEEVSDLEDELIGFDTRINKFKNEVASLEEDLANRRHAIKDAEKLIKKYQEQQANVKNNREYEAVTKEIELQKLDIELIEKKIREGIIKLEAKKLDINRTQISLEDRQKDLIAKKEELEIIMSESNDEEEVLKKERSHAATFIEERLMISYNRLRSNSLNGLAVVMVKRDACGGCFNTVPPQRKSDINDRKKIIVCEHCGRIFAGVEVYDNPTSLGRNK